MGDRRRVAEIAEPLRAERQVAGRGLHDELCREDDRGSVMVQPTLHHDTRMHGRSSDRSEEEFLKRNNPVTVIKKYRGEHFTQFLRKR